MPDVSPELAGKVLAAEQRNLVKGVGDGGKLSTAERQSFMAFAAASGDDDLARLRKTSLLRMWLFGKTLTQEQLDEIAGELPVPSAKVSRERYQRAPTDYGHIAVSRRTYFRWLGYGKECPAGADLPPFDEPAALELWYERMRVLGFFKNAFPKEIKRAIVALCGSQPAVAVAGSTAAAGVAGQVQAVNGAAPQIQPAQQSTHGMHLLNPGTARGLMMEVEHLEQRTAQLRMQRDHAEKSGMPTAKELTMEYNETVDKLSLIKRRALDAAEREKLLVNIDDIEAVFTPKITTIVTGVPFMFDRIDLELQAEPDRQKRRAIFRKAWLELCRTFVSGGFAPPLQLESLVA